MGYGQTNRAVIQAVYALAWLLSATSPTFAKQHVNTISSERWHPKDGIYAGKNTNCAETADLYLELGENSLSAGDEELCKVIKSSDTVPDAILESKKTK